MRTRKVPLRKCVACQEMKSKKELIRIVKSPEDDIGIDVSGKKPGRGAYLCGSTSCLKRAQKSGALERALKIKIPQDIYLRLEQEFIFPKAEEGTP